MKAHLLKHFRFFKTAVKFSALFLIILTPQLSAQDPSDDIFKTKLGATAGFNWNSHSADFKELPGVDNCCPLFESGEGTGFNAGILYEMRHYSGFTFGLRANYSVQNAVLKGTQEIDVIAQDTTQRGTFENSIAAQFSTFALEPIAMYNPIGDFHVLAGMRLGFAATKNYSQKEVIIEPQSGVFKENGKRIRNERSGEIPGANMFQAALLFGATSEFPLNKNKTIFIAPEIIVQIALNDIISGTDWKANALRAGFSLKYAL
ncbi:MAG: hypothetical protein V4642_15570 [Bacteroidota bacterium]